jgi:purine-cytosine permease-like protein
MPNLLPDWLPWIRPAGRLIWSLIATGVGLAFVATLIRPPLERKVVTARQAVAGAVVLFVLGIFGAKLLADLQTVVVWVMFGGLLAIALAAVASRDLRSPDQPTTWAEAMTGALAVLVLFTLVYGVIPHEWLTFANSYLNMSSDRFIKEPFWPFYNTVKLPFSAIRDTVAALIYVVGIGGNVVLWVKWQERLTPKPEPAEGAGAAEVIRTSRFGRPLKAKA